MIWWWSMIKQWNDRHINWNVNVISSRRVGWCVWESTVLCVYVSVWVCVSITRATLLNVIYCILSCSSLFCRPQTLSPLLSVLLPFRLIQDEPCLNPPQLPSSQKQSQPLRLEYKRRGRGAGWGSGWALMTGPPFSCPVSSKQGDLLKSWQPPHPVSLN